MSDEGFFKINQDTEFKFKDLYGFTFVFEENILRINEKISSAELKRVGILDSSIFEWKNAFCSPFFEVISKNIKHRHADTIKNQGAFNCAFMHYECMKMAEAMNYSKILIIEEDLVFLKSLDTIVKILDAMPNTDVCLLDKWCGNPYKWKADLAEKRYDCNEYFRYFDVNS